MCEIKERLKICCKEWKYQFGTQEIKIFEPGFKLTTDMLPIEEVNVNGIYKFKLDMGSLYDDDFVCKNGTYTSNILFGNQNDVDIEEQKKNGWEFKKAITEQDYFLYVTYFEIAKEEDNSVRVNGRYDGIIYGTSKEAIVDAINTYPPIIWDTTIV